MVEIGWGDGAGRAIEGRIVLGSCGGGAEVGEVVRVRGIVDEARIQCVHWSEVARAVVEWACNATRSVGQWLPRVVYDSSYSKMKQ